MLSAIFCSHDANQNPFLVQRILLMMLTKVFLVRVALGAQKTYE